MPFEVQQIILSFWSKEHNASPTHITLNVYMSLISKALNHDIGFAYIVPMIYSSISSVIIHHAPSTECSVCFLKQACLPCLRFTVRVIIRDELVDCRDKWHQAHHPRALLRSLRGHQAPYQSLLYILRIVLSSAVNGNPFKAFIRAVIRAE